MAAGIVLAAGAFFVPGTAQAQRAGKTIHCTFSENIGEFAYANLKQARSQKWFSAIAGADAAGALPPIERFLASAGVDPNSQVEEVAGASSGRGHIQNGKARAPLPCRPVNKSLAWLSALQSGLHGAFFKQQKLPTFKIARIHDVRDSAAARARTTSSFSS